MRIVITQDGRVLEGTPVQIIQTMQSVAFGQDDKSVEEYIDWMADQLDRFMEISVTVKGDDAASKAASFIQEMVAHGLAKQLD